MSTKDSEKMELQPFFGEQSLQTPSSLPCLQGLTFSMGNLKNHPTKSCVQGFTAQERGKKKKKNQPELLCCFLLCSAAWRQKIWVNRRSPGSSLQPLVNWSVQIAGTHPTAWWGGDGCYILLHTSYFQIDSFQNAWVLWKYFLSYS